LGMASKVLWRCWYRRLERRAPEVGESGVEYARRLLAAGGWEYSIEKTWEGGGRCIRSQRRLLLPPRAWDRGLDGVLAAAHEAGHALLDGGLFASGCVSGVVPAVVAVVWLAAVLAAGWLGIPALAFVAVGVSLLLVGDMLVCEVRTCLFARDAVQRDFPDPACRAWAQLQTRAEVWHMVLMAVALSLLFVSAAAVFYALGAGRVVWNGLA